MARKRVCDHCDQVIQSHQTFHHVYIRIRTYGDGENGEGPQGEGELCTKCYNGIFRAIEKKLDRFMIWG